MLPDDFPNGCHPHLISSQLYKLSSEGYFPREVWCCALRDSLCKHVLKVTLQGIWWEKLLSKRDLVFCAEIFSLHACAELCICKGFDVLHWEISVWESTGCRLLDLLELILSALQTLVNFLFMIVIAYLYCSSNLVKRFEMASVSENKLQAGDRKQRSVILIAGQNLWTFKSLNHWTVWFNLMSSPVSFNNVFESAKLHS